MRRGCCVRLPSTSLRARLRHAPGAPSLPVPGPRSPVSPSFTSRGAPTRLCFLPLATEETDEDDGRHVLCAVCHARSGVCQACARHCPACRPALSPSALTTGGWVRARFRLRHAGPESVPAAQRPPEPPQRRPSPSSLGPQRSPSTTPALATSLALSFCCATSSGHTPPSAPGLNHSPPSPLLLGHFKARASF